MPVCNRKQLNLHGSKPSWESACKMLCKNTDKSFDAAENNTMNHDRAMLCAVCTHIFEFKSFGKLEIKLNCAALPCSAKAIFKMEIKLRAVKCAVALIYLKS